MQQFFIAFGAAVGGSIVFAIGWSAYRHPQSFRYVALALLAIYVGASIAAIGYDYGNSRAYSAVSALPTQGLTRNQNGLAIDQGSAMSAIAAQNPAVVGYAMLAGLLLGVVVAVLSSLPAIGLVHKDAYHDAEGEEDGKAGTKSRRKTPRKPRGTGRGSP